MLLLEGVCLKCRRRMIYINSAHFSIEIIVDEGVD